MKRKIICAALAAEEDDGRGQRKGREQCGLHGDADDGVGICGLFHRGVQRPGEGAEHSHNGEGAVLHRAYKHAQSRHTDGDILQQMPALAEECEAVTNMTIGFM